MKFNSEFIEGVFLGLSTVTSLRSLRGFMGSPLFGDCQIIFKFGECCGHNEWRRLEVN